VNPESNYIETLMEKLEHTFGSGKCVETWLLILEVILIEVNVKVKNPREAVTDSNAILELAILGKERIKNLHCEYRTFNNCDFMNRLVSR
jgi:hypothetical protein